MRTTKKNEKRTKEKKEQKKKEARKKKKCLEDEWEDDLSENWVNNFTIENPPIKGSDLNKRNW